MYDRNQLKILEDNCKKKRLKRFEVGIAKAVCDLGKNDGAFST
jgi:hypothetical protein